MKICILGSGMLVEEFKDLDYIVIDQHFLDFKIEHVLDYDVIINTYDYKCEIDGHVDYLRMKQCNIDLPLLLSEFCSTRRKRYVQLSTALLYLNDHSSQNAENASICSDDAYLASKLFAERQCNKNDLIVRTGNLFCDSPVKENTLFKAVTTPTPTKNLESYTWTVDFIRALITLLKDRQKGIFNICSNISTSQFEICEYLELKDKIPIVDPKSRKYVQLDLAKLHAHFIPMEVNINIKREFEKMKELLGES